jgi:hypothetical protein
MSAGVYWFRIVKGEDFNRTVTWYPNSTPTDLGTPADLTGYSAHFYVDLNNSPIISVASPANITLGGPAGTVQVFIPASAFAAVQDFSEASYRLMLTSPSGGISCLLTGQFTKEGETG